MLTFKQFLKEVQRDPLRSAKLIVNLAKRYPNKKDSLEPSRNFKPDRNLMATPIKSWDNDKDWKNSSDEDQYKFHDKMLEHPGDFRPKHVEMSSLRHVQDNVHLPTLMTKTMKGETDMTLPSVFHHNGRHYIIDGHHQIAAARIRGDKKIKVMCGHND